VNDDWANEALLEFQIAQLSTIKAECNNEIVAQMGTRGFG
jgi:hypothetical protein